MAREMVSRPRYIPSVRPRTPGPARCCRGVGHAREFVGANRHSCAQTSSRGRTGPLPPQPAQAGPSPTPKHHTRGVRRGPMNVYRVAWYSFLLASRGMGPPLAAPTPARPRPPASPRPRRGHLQGTLGGVAGASAGLGSVHPWPPGGIQVSVTGTSLHMTTPREARADGGSGRGRSSFGSKARASRPADHLRPHSGQTLTSP